MDNRCHQRRALARLVGVFVLALVAALPAVAGAQDAPLAGRGPRFLVAPTPTSAPRPLDLRTAPVLRREIELRLQGATMPEALAAITKATGLAFVYGLDLLPAKARVNLRAEQITVAAALTQVLIDTDLDVLLLPSGRQVALVKRGAGVPRVQGGSIVGRVSDAKTGEPLAGAEVYLEGTRWRTATAQDGRYRLAEVTPGNYTLAVRRVGYGKQSRAIVVAEGAEVTIDVALLPVATQLNEIVTTVTGDQRRVELGHVVGRINADSLAREAPVSTLSELLTGRVPGLQVFQTQGTVGGRATLQIRGPNSFSLRNEPVVIIDGVRYTSETETRGLFRSNGGPASGNEATSPLNDLNPNDIESVEVVKGPSAATLYGTDAANGVLVITTKRGRAGPARWQAYGKTTTTEIRTRDLPDIYWGWGTVSNVPNNPNLSCTLDRLASGQCTRQDSVTVIQNPLKDPQYSMFDAKPAWEYGLSVAGGQQALRYYFSADFRDAAGPIRLPPALAEELKARHGLTELPRAWREPNRQTNLSLLSNVSASLTPTLELRVNTRYLRSATNAFSFGGTVLYGDVMFRPTAAQPHQYTLSAGPDTRFAREATDNVDRFVGSASGEWRPAGWLATRATLGLDFRGSRDYGLLRPGIDTGTATLRGGLVEDTRTRQATTTADFSVTATARHGRLSARTAVGTQYVRSLSDVAGSFGQGLAPGQSVVPGAVTVQSGATYRETVVLGGYVEEMLGLNDRLFLTGALRIDGASAFGRDFAAVIYPKLGASWLLTAEPFMPRLPGLEELRLRYALGISGQQPDPAWARPGFRVQQMDLNGQRVNWYQNTSLGNPALRPERVREHEFGFDANAFESRLTLEVTWFRRRTTDQLISQAGPPGIGDVYQNLGLTTQRGFEAKLEARVLATRPVSLDLALQHSNYVTRLVDIGTGLMVRAFGGGYVEGYPLGARFGQPIIGWEDRNADGILVQPELVLTDTAVYLGESRPSHTQTLSAVLGLADRRVRVSALLDRKAGFTQIDPLTCPAHRTCREAVDRNTPLEAQARMWAILLGGGFPQPGGFVRLREVTLAVDLPTRVLRAVRLHQGTLVLSGRNLALWTDFTGPDPEVGSADLALTAAPNVAGGSAAGIPLGRVFSVRLDLGL